MTDRADGFYWIIDGKGEPEVAAWSHGQWWLTGSEEPALDGHVVVLGGCLAPPDGAAAPS